WDLRYFIGVLASALLTDFNAGNRRGLEKEVLNHFRHQAAFLGLGRLAYNRGEVKLAFRQPFERGIRDIAKEIRVYLLDDALLDQLLGHLVMRIHVAQHLFELLCREYLSQHIEDLAGAPGV